MNERFEELLPWYANGTLGDDDRAFVDDYLRQHPEARSELAWYESLQTKVRENGPAVSPSIGLERTMKLIHGDSPSFAQRLQNFFSSFAMRPAVGLAALALVVVQGGVIVELLGNKDEGDGMRAIRATRVDDAPILKVNFSPEAREADIRLLIVQVEGDLAGGPGQLGDWYLRVPKGREQAVLEQLQKNPIVQAAALAPGVPPRE